MPAPSKPVTYTPIVDRGYAGTVAGTFQKAPLGIILHGSRSGSTSNTREQEYRGTCRYAAAGIELGWNATLADDQLATHMLLTKWGWNAREYSSAWLAVEFAQAVEAWEITDGQVRAFAWFYQRARDVWPELPRVFPTHAEIPPGVRDGKSDPFTRGSVRIEALRDRIIARLNAQGVTYS